MLKMEVEDQGRGIPTDLQRSIFEPFNRGVFGHSTLADKLGGTKLGLSVSAQLVALVGGSITVKSKIGMGSTFIAVVRLCFGGRRN